MSKRVNRRVRRQLSDEDSSVEIPFTSTPSGNLVPPSFGFQTIQKGGKKVIRRVSSSPSVADSNEAAGGYPEDEVDQRSSSASPQNARIVRQPPHRQVHPQPSTSSRKKARHHSNDPQHHQQVDQRSSSASAPQNARIVRQPPHRQVNQRPPAASSPERARSVRHPSDPQPQRIRSRSRTPLGQQKSNPVQAPPQNPSPRRRKRVYEAARKEIIKLQRGTELLIPRLSFSRAVREVTQQILSQKFNWQRQALEALHEATEYYLVELFEVSLLCSMHARRVTVMKKDMELARRVWGHL